MSEVLSPTMAQKLSIPHFECSSSSEEEDFELAPEGYKDGILMEYWRFCNNEWKQRVDCSGCRKVFVDINAHELKRVNDQEETFQVILMLKFYWLDKGLKLSGEVYLKNGDKVRGEVVQLASNGDIDLILTIGTTKTMTHIKRGEYKEVSWDQEEMMNQRFFPHYTFGNMQGEPLEILKPSYNFLWSNNDNTFVCWQTKLDATFDESLELQHFPLDRQLCRLKITAEKPIEDFQFVLVKKDFKVRLSKCVEAFEVDQEMHGLCHAYIRYNDYNLPYNTQRSMINVIFHVDRVGDYYFNNILLMVFLVNVMALCTFSIPLDDVSGRLGMASSCFLAVLAYRYIINEILPRKSYLTGADKYMTFACAYLIAICLETVVVTSWRSQIIKLHDVDSDEDGGGVSARMRRKRRIAELNQLDYKDAVCGILLGLFWVFCNLYLWCLWKWSRRQHWHSVYTVNKEPYAPIEKCTGCGTRWLSKQCDHTDPGKRQQCQDGGCPGFRSKDHVRKLYLTPKEVAPLVPLQPLPMLQR